MEATDLVHLVISLGHATVALCEHDRRGREDQAYLNLEDRVAMIQKDIYACLHESGCTKVRMEFNLEDGSTFTAVMWADREGVLRMRDGDRPFWRPAYLAGPSIN